MDLNEVSYFLTASLTYTTCYLTMAHFVILQPTLKNFHKKFYVTAIYQTSEKTLCVLYTPGSEKNRTVREKCRNKIHGHYDSSHQFQKSPLSSLKESSIEFCSSLP